MSQLKVLNWFLIWSQALMESECLPGLIQALVSPGTPVEALLRLTSCLHRLMSFGEAPGSRPLAV